MSVSRPKNTTLNVLGREYNDLLSSKYSINLVRNRFAFAKDLYRKDLYSHYGCVNAIEFSDNGQWLVSGGDDRRILLWDVQKAISGVGSPQTMKGEHNSNIFCLGFDSHCQRLFSAGNDELVMIHDSATAETIDVILHNDAIYGLSVNPVNDNVFASACDDGRVCIWDLRNESSRRTTVLARYSTAFHAVMYNPAEPRLIATANTKEGIALWDVRKPLCVLQQFNSSLLSSQSAMSVRFNRNGTLVLALRRRLPPVLYNLKSSYPIVEFDDSNYYNSCTMKSCSFGGDSDQYILSGSDDFKLYMWKIPEQIYEDVDSNSPQAVWVDKADLVLSGHRSIVNQVRYNYTNSLIASSGVEKVIKLWSTFPLPEGTGSLDKKSTYKQSRKVFSHEDYINLVLETGQFVTHDYSHQSVQEDPRMMAFFDSLVQRDIEGWTTDSSDSIDGESSLYELCWNRPIHSGDDRSSNSSGEDSDHAKSPVPDLNSHYFKYLDIISKRIESNESNSKLNTSSAESTSQSTATNSGTASAPMSSSAIKDRLMNGSKQTRNSENNTLNRISELITEKKREQLRKLIKYAVRTTRKKLKRIEKRSETKAKYDLTEDETESYKQRLNELKQKLDFLSEKVNTESNGPESKSLADRRQAFNNHRNYRRLRFLTNQSDLVFNEVLPIVSSSSSSDSDDDSNFVSGEELYNAISSEMSRMRSIINGDSDSSDSSSDDSLLVDNRPKTASTAPPMSREFIDSSSSDEEVTEKTATNDENKQSKSQSNNSEPKQDSKAKTSANRVSFLSNLVSKSGSESDTDSETETNQRCVDSVIHCPYKHDLCHASTSSSQTNQVQTNSDNKNQIIFKPIDNRRRSYRKRKRSGNNRENRNSVDKKDNSNVDSENNDKKNTKSD